MAYSCQRCGHILERPTPFCPQCGTAAALPPQPAEAPKSKRAWILPAVSISAVVFTAGVSVYVEEQRKQSAAAAARAAAAPTPIPVPRTDAERVAVAKRLLTAASSSADLQAGVSFLKQVPKGAPEYKEAQLLIKQGEALHKQQLQAERDDAARGPAPKVIGDTVWCVDRFLKRNLNDYDSAEYLSWSAPTKMTYRGQPYWGVSLRLRAKNAFGGKIIKDALFFVRNEQVVEYSGL